MKNQTKKRKLYKRCLSALMAISLTLNITPFNVFHRNSPSEIFNPPFEDSLMVTASAAELTYTPSNDDKTRFATSGTAFANNAAGKADFLDFCYFYQTDDTFAATYENATISVNFITFPDEFMGLGNENVKFRGDFRIQDTGEANINIPRAIFTHVYDSAKITNANGTTMTMKVVKTSDQSSPLIAEYVYHDTAEGATSSSWNVTVASENSNPYAGVIGEMEDGAKLTIAYTNNSSALVSSTSNGTDGVADVGAICGCMKGSSELSVGISAFADTTISSANGNAGGLVGGMEGTSKLTITSLPSDMTPTVNATGTGVDKGFAGGVVGSMLSSASVDTTALGTGAFNIDGTISGINGAGGYCGRYVNSAEDATLDLSKYNITTTVSGNSSGGVFGVLENQSEKYTITGGGTGVNDPQIASECISGNYGGIIGTYTTTTLSNTLHLKNMNAFAEATDTLITFGGAIGKVDSVAYIRSDTVRIEVDGANHGWFGGLVGETSADDGVFIDLADFTLDADGFTGGGVVGKFHNGVLRLSGITDMTNATVGGTWTTAAKYGQLVGENDNVLVYALGTGANGASAVFTEGAITTAATGWTFKRSSNSIADDLGTWGEVIRITDVETDILTLDTSAHTVTLKAAQTTMDSTVDLLLTALNIQLNQKTDYDCLLFTDASTSARDTLLAGTLTISGSQSFSGTGVNGFMRDGSDSIGTFTGTLTGGTITLAIGEKYGFNVTSESTGEGLGQIYRHPYNGLFSVIGSSTKVNDVAPTVAINTLTLQGTINVRNAGMTDMYIGGIGAKADGSVTLDGITASQSVSYHEGTSIDSVEIKGKNIGGLIGVLSSSASDSTIAVTGTNEISTAFALSGYHQSWVALGSFIGKVLSPSFTINIAQPSSDSLTDKHTTSVSNITAGANADGGGLIGYIIRNGAYSDRKINIDNLTFNGCTVSNIATTNGGGLLGYAWLETDTTIGGTNGIIVTDATITNSTPANVGAMCYQATGKWTVNKLAVNKLTMTGGAGTSLGMLVNKAYNTYTGDIDGTTYNMTDGLYLDVLNSGYTYTTSAITLPTAGVYDELAVYTAQDVLKGRYTVDTTIYGAGVVSINMGTRSGNTVSVASTGTYQNKMTSQTKPNPNARYYYNLDRMAKTDATQDVVLWSVNKYAAENIKTEFDASTNPLNRDAATNINFTGISFYPVYSASGNTVKNINITFDYSGLFNAESYGSTNTDSYIRDPGAMDTLRNQHYLMQSGLFIEQGEGSTLTVNNSSLAGTFLEVGGYKGVLISTTSHGSVKINGLELRGITPKITGNSAYANGYLLVNSINRENAQKATITLQVENVRTATDTNYKYAEKTITTGEGEGAVTSTITAQVAKSLFGAAYGPGLNISFNKMKLDAREPGTLSTNTALNNVYGTLNSIFTDSTFLASLKTDSLPMPYYNYAYEEDWGEGGTDGTRWVTYGKEVSSSVEHLDREHLYYKSEDKFTDPTNANAAAPSTAFSSGWLPYVGQAYTANQTPDTNGCYYREIRVNISDVVTSSGCGTYNDPYIINEDNQNGSDKNFLANVAAFLRSGEGQNLPNLYLPTNYTDYDTLAKNTAGNRWCENGNTHAEFTYDSNTGAYTYTPEGGSAISWDADDVRLYLENAYYKVEGSITLPAGFVGLGGDSGTDVSGLYAFRGVIVGSNNATITNNSSNPLILVSNGSVVKNISVVQNANVELKQYKNTSTDAAFGYKIPSQKNETGAGCAYYGGIIGEIMGGDNIIDNCYVTQGDDVSVSLSGDAALLCPVGSYVGVIVYGGLIFKNMVPLTANTNAQAFKAYMGNDTSVNLTAATSKGAIYVNPYVGRVINGYAVNESTQLSVTENGKYHDDEGTTRNGAKHSLKNGSKHYSIADIKKYSSLTDAEKLNVTAVAASGTVGNIDVPNAQALFILSLITQSCAGTAQISDGEYYSSLSYGANVETPAVYGMSHNAEYDDVGTAESSSNDYTELACDDTAANTAIPYIIRHYTCSRYNTVTTVTTDVAVESSVAVTEVVSTSTAVKTGLAVVSSKVETETEIVTAITTSTTTTTTTTTTATAPATTPATTTTTASSSESSISYPEGTVTETYTSYSTSVSSAAKTEKYTETSTEAYTSEKVEVNVTYTLVTVPFDGEATDLDGKTLKLANGGQYLTNELVPITEYKQRDHYYKGTSDFNEAVIVHFDKVSGTTNQYYLWIGDASNKEYFIIDPLPKTVSTTRGYLELGKTPAPFTVTKNSDGTWHLRNNDQNLSRESSGGHNGFWSYDGNSPINLINSEKSIVKTTRTKTTTYNVTKTKTTTYYYVNKLITSFIITSTKTIETFFGYPARCITSTAGYYNINLTNTTANYVYQLPDSFRGLGCVGFYDSITNTAASGSTPATYVKDNKFSMKVNKFDGKGCTIDEDIYINKYKYDNYFDKLHKNTTQDLTQTADLVAINGNTNTDNHGIGLFDSLIMKQTTGTIKDFDLTGSVRTAIFNDGQECHEIGSEMLFLSVGGVCGWATNNAVNIGFEGINLKNLTICGTNHFGGLLGYSGLKSPADKNDKTNYQIRIKECTADNISLIATAGTIIETVRQARCGMGAFVGKVQEGAVYIYGTEYEDANSDPDNNYSEVKIGNYELINGDTLNHNMSAGGLVGFAGNGCKIYDMHLSSKSSAITVGGDWVNFAGGMVGGMQSSLDGGKTGIAVFKNCIVQNINVNGNYAGGIYGGKWDSNWTTYSITMDNCQVIGTPDTHNIIFGNDSFGDNSNTIVNHVAYAGGLIGKLYPYTNLDDNKKVTHNILIKDCVVKNYDITSATTVTSYAGGFIGYASSKSESVTCYLHDSSVENCKIGADGNYAGGVVGRVIPKANNQIMGYNIKLNTITTDAGNQMGAWIGYVPSDETVTVDGKLNKTSIQLSGMAIYGKGYKNVGNDATLNTASFVFADYGGACNSMTTANENKATFNISADVTMPKYPYVNVNPQSNMGVRSDSTNAVISGDGAVLLDSKVPTYSIYTSAQTMAAKLYADIKTGTYDRRYTTCTDVLKNDVISEGHKFEYYLQRTTNDDGDRISTYRTEHGTLPTGVEDFACIMISTADADETTNLINQYIRLVTNTTNNYAETNDYYAVDIKTCKLVEDASTGTGEFQLITDSTDPDYAPGIVHDTENNQFKMTEIKSNADSNKDNTFTLIDVQFKDPMHTNKVAYHLYVPVYTTVQLEVNFSAAMKSGTNSISYLANGITVDQSIYEDTLDDADYIHIDNLNTWYTMYFRYSYSKSDLEALLNKGNLNWNHEKYVTLTKLGNAITNMLPESTFMTLVNPNSGSDKVYYVNALNSTNFPRKTYVDSYGETRVSLTLNFNKFKGVDNQPFRVASLNEMIAQDLEAIQITGETHNGLYDYEGTDEPADFSTVSYVYVMDAAGNKTYYKYNTDGTGQYNLQFKSGFTQLDEDYYVSAYVPESNMNTIYGYDISIDDKFPAPSAGETNALPKSANVVTGYDSRLVYLGDLYDQSVTFQVEPSDQVITSSNKILDAYAETTIKAKSIPILGILASAKNYTDLYHSYVLTLDRHGESGEIMTKIYGLEKNEDQTSRVKAWYSFDAQISGDDNPTENQVSSVDVQSNYINVATVKDNDNLMDRIAPDADHITPVTIYSRIRMDFDATKLETEFPQKTRSDAGVSVRVASNLAYDTSGLAFSSSSVSKNDSLGHLYHRTSMDTASLYYKPLTPNIDKYDFDGEYSENYTRVGVNGRRAMSAFMPIDTVANYDLSKVAQSWENDATSVRLTISLQKKTDTKENGKVTKVQYTNISDITQYWGGIELTNDKKPLETLVESNGDSSFRLSLKDTTSIVINNVEYGIAANTDTITVTIPKSDLTYDASSYLVTIPISFNVKTGNAITQYANFKVNLTAQLLDSTNAPIDSCTANDYIVYTNAKVNNEFLSDGNG